LLEVTNMFFTILFLVELSLRLLTSHKQDVWNYWLWFDTAIVTSSFAEVLGVISIDTKIIRSVRIVRLLRVVRVLRVVRMIRFLDSLFFLIRSIQASFSCLVWSFVLLFFLQLTVGLMLNQLVRMSINNESLESNLRADLFAYFGTFTKTMITMFEITLSNWVPSCRKLMEVSEVYGLFYIIYRCMCCFAVVSVITAVFITETAKSVQKDEEIQMMQNAKDNASSLKKMKELFNEADESGDGLVSLGEFQKFFQNPRVIQWLSTTQDLNIEDTEELFELLDDGDGKISIDELFGGLGRLKGPARSKDVVTLLSRTRSLEHKIETFMGTMTQYGALRNAGIKTHRDVEHPKWRL